MSATEFQVPKGTAFAPVMQVDTVSGELKIEGLQGYGAVMGPGTRCVHCGGHIQVRESWEVHLAVPGEWRDAVFEHASCRRTAGIAAGGFDD